MDTRSKRKTTSATEEKPEGKTKEVSKKAKNESKKDSNDAEMRKKLKTESQMSKEGVTLNGLLPAIKREPNKAISDADLEKLFFALVGDTGKKFDSNDSLNSEIDFMDDDEIKARDQRFRETIDYIRKLPEQQDRLLQILKIGNETPEEKEERRRKIREFKWEHKTALEREQAERKRVEKLRRAEKRLNTKVDVFGGDLEKTKKNPDGPSLLAARQFSRCLGVIADCIEKDVLSEDGGYPDIRKTVKEICTEMLDKRLRSAGIKGTFFCDGKTPAEYLKKKVRKLFFNDDILDVLDGGRYGFDFNTKDSLHALSNYFSENSANGRLVVQIRQFVVCSYYVARGNDKDFKLNENLNYAMFG